MSADGNDYVRNMANSRDREKALEAALPIDKQSKGSVMRLGDETRAPMEVIPTSSIALDVQLLGIGGFPRGRVVEVYGQNRRARPQWPGMRWPTRSAPCGIAAFIDAEHALDHSYAEKLGVDTDSCWSPSRTPVSRPWI